MDILNTVYNKPIEREYEAWIINCIEKYFKKINKQVRIFAFSPIKEKEIPTDEIISFNYKVIGLQFKNVYCSELRIEQKKYDYSNIKWILNNPKEQFERIKRIPEIFYCLPTFINRNYKKAALEHCLFWRPINKMKAETYWYNNDRRNSIESTSFRWGKLMELINGSSIGDIQKSKLMSAKAIYDGILNYGEVSNVEMKVESFEGLYAIVVET